MLTERDVYLAPQIKSLIFKKLRVKLAPKVKCLIFKELRVKLAPLAKKFHQVEKSVLTYHSITWDTNRYEMTLAPR